MWSGAADEDDSRLLISEREREADAGRGVDSAASSKASCSQQQSVVGPGDGQRDGCIRLPCRSCVSLWAGRGQRWCPPLCWLDWRVAGGRAQVARSSFAQSKGPRGIRWPGGRVEGGLAVVVVVVEVERREWSGEAGGSVLVLSSRSGVWSSRGD